MGAWLKNVSARVASRLLVSAIVGQVGLGTIMIAVWQFLVVAPLLMQVAFGLAVLVLLATIAIFSSILLRSPPGPGIFTPRHLRRFKLPFWRLSWNFDNYLGGRSGAGSPVEVTSFQAAFKINRGRGIHPRKAFIECEATGERQDVLVECGNPYLSAEEIEFIPRAKWYRCTSAFKSDRSGEQGLLKEEFLRRWSGFDFVFESDECKFRHHFPRRENEDCFDRFWRYSNPPPDPKPRLVLK